MALYVLKRKALPNTFFCEKKKKSAKKKKRSSDTYRNEAHKTMLYFRQVQIYKYKGNGLEK